jgi:amino acid permease
MTAEKRRKTEKKLFPINIDNIKKDIKKTFSVNIKKTNFSSKFRKLKIIISLLALIAIFFMLYFAYLNLRFAIKDDLIIDLPNRYISLNSTSQTPAKLDITSDVQTSFFCGASCTHQLVSLNSNQTIYRGKLYIQKIS